MRVPAVSRLKNAENRLLKSPCENSQHRTVRVSKRTLNAAAIVRERTQRSTFFQTFPASLTLSGIFTQALTRAAQLASARLRSRFCAGVLTRNQKPFNLWKRRIRRGLNGGVAMLLAGVLVVVLAPMMRGWGSSPIKFALQWSPFRLENDETEDRHYPAVMAGGLAVFDYNGDGRPDIFFTNGANLATLRKDDPKYSNRLYRNDGNGKFTDVTKKAGLAGTGYDMGAAVGDFDNDGHLDLFVAGVHHNTLYHNNGDGTFTDVTAKAGLNHSVDPKYGPIWSVAAAWVDVNHDGLLDLFVVN